MYTLRGQTTLIEGGQNFKGRGGVIVTGNVVSGITLQSRAAPLFWE